MRVAHLIESDGPGGAERVLVHLVRHLADHDVDNVVLLPGEGEGWIAKQLPTARADIVHVPLRSSVPDSIRYITRIFETTRPDVAHAHEFTMAVCGAAAAVLSRTPLVLTMHGSRYYASRLRRRVATLAAIVSSHATVAVSHTVASNLIHDLSVPRRRIRVIPNGVPSMPRVTPTLRKELNLPHGAKLIASVGNLYPVKGHKHLVAALAGVQSSVPWPVHLAIAGRGDQQQPLRRLAEDLGLSDYVHLLGLRDDIPNILGSADLFVLPSLSEALPVALLEAMGAGLPVVATSVGDVPLVLESGDAGALVPPGDPAALTRSITSLLIDRPAAVRMAGRARSLFSSRYGIGQMTARYSALYSEARG